jgi:hypothetical protein
MATERTKSNCLILGLGEQRFVNGSVVSRGMITGGASDSSEGCHSRSDTIPACLKPCAHFLRHRRGGSAARRRLTTAQTLKARRLRAVVRLPAFAFGRANRGNRAGSPERLEHITGDAAGFDWPIFDSPQDDRSPRPDAHSY